MKMTQPAERVVNRNLVKYKTASMAAFALSVGCIIWLAGTQSLFANGPVTIAVQVAAVLLMIWARVTFRSRSFHAAANPTAGGIVTNGPYHFIRHPIYAAIFYFLAAGAIAHPSMINGVVVVVTDLTLFVRMRTEEILLIQRYPEYGAYAQRTSRILPGVW
jgi:protein-S-isoprenylcysteine O-methyltransferase Ste14